MMLMKNLDDSDDLLISWEHHARFRQNQYNDIIEAIWFIMDDYWVTECTKLDTLQDKSQFGMAITK